MAMVSRARGALVRPAGIRSVGRIARTLVQNGVAVEPGFLPRRLVRQLARQAHQERQAGEFRAAGVGAGAARRIVTEVRSDHVRWLDEVPGTPAERDLQHRLEALRVAVNRETMLGLFCWEGHLAVYPEGAFYRRHLDVFANARSRKVTTVCYLNEDWQPGDGGQLRVYAGKRSAEVLMDVAPVGGTLVTFLSEEFAHEVLPARAPRVSTTGWFRVREGATDF